jgi:hypothetical protein
MKMLNGLKRGFSEVSRAICNASEKHGNFTTAIYLVGGVGNVAVTALALAQGQPEVAAFTASGAVRAFSFFVPEAKSKRLPVAPLAAFLIAANAYCAVDDIVKGNAALLSGHTAGMVLGYLSLTEAVNRPEPAVRQDRLAL